MSRKWHKGPPPHVGWWAASLCRDGDAWRWWDGERWSKAVYPKDLPHIVALTARSAMSNDWNSVLEWSDYYPKNARVPRIDPRKVKT